MTGGSEDCSCGNPIKFHNILKKQPQLKKNFFLYKLMV
jgi:hypothetical protein